MARASVNYWARNWPDAVQEAIRLGRVHTAKFGPPDGPYRVRKAGRNWVVYTPNGWIPDRRYR